MKAKTDAQLASEREIEQARRARLASARSLYDIACRKAGPRGPKRSDLARVVIALGHNVTTATTRNQMLFLINEAGL